MPEDLGLTNKAISDLFEHPYDQDQWLDLALNEAQSITVESGYLHGIKILNTEQIKTLGEQLHEMVDPNHEGNEFFYEYHSNESEDLIPAIFHALGAWRVRTAFHDILWSPAF